MSSQPTVKSPCVRNCCLNNDNVCLGCGRKLDEITGWRDYSPEEQMAVLKKASQRRESFSAPGG